MILSETQLQEIRRRLKVSTVPDWKTIPGMSEQIVSMKRLLTDAFTKKRNEA
jgi:hypothetical protein